MTFTFRCFFSLLLLFWGTFRLSAQSLPTTFSEKRNGARFIENKGQWNENVRYRLRLTGGDLFFENQSLTYAFTQVLEEETHEHKHRQEEKPQVKGHAYRVKFLNSNPQPAFIPRQAYRDYANYYYGKDPSKWASHVLSYAELTYEQVYAGINMQFYQKEDNLKYDFIVEPNADASQIQLKYEGVDKIELKAGNLEITTSVREITELKPIAYQVVGEEKRNVACVYHLANDVLSFDFPNGYNHNLPLYIDPTVVFSTYIGATTDSRGVAATYDAVGNAFAAGYTFDNGYPVTNGAFQTTFTGAITITTDVTITKFEPNGTYLLYSTYLGGGEVEFPNSMIVNSQDELLIMGRTTSGNFPVTPNAYDFSQNGGFDIFVTKFDANGTLMASTFVGGSADESNNTASDLDYNYQDDKRGEIIVDAQDNCYIGSCTVSTDFPSTSGVLQTTNKGGQDGVICRLTPDLSILEWSTYWGGSGSDAVYGIKVGGGAISVTGGTSSSDFPVTPSALHNSFQGDVDGFVSKLDFGFSALIASTYIGTAAYDQSFLIQLDLNNDVYITGQSLGNFPITNALYGVPNAPQFIAKMDATLSSYIFSTTYGNPGTSMVNISPTSFLVDNCEHLYVGGWGGAANGSGLGGTAGGTTNNMDISANAIQTTTDGSDFYFMVLEPNATALLYATYWGGPNESEHVHGGISRFDPKGVVYQTICASCNGSSSFPTTPGVWSPLNGASGVSTGNANCNLAMFKIDFGFLNIQASFDPTDTVSNSLVTSGCAPLPLEFLNSTPQGQSLQYSWNFGDPSSGANNTSALYSPIHTFQNPGIYTVTMVAYDPNGCFLPDTVIQYVNVKDGPPSPFLLDSIICLNGATNVMYDTLNGTASAGALYIWDFGGGAVLSGTPGGPGPFQVQWGNLGNYNISLFVVDSGCIGPITTHNVQVVNGIIPNFVIPDTTCALQLEMAVYTGTMNGLLTAYSWSWGSATAVTGIGQGPYQVFWGIPGTQTVCLDVLQQGCFTPPSVCKQVEVLPKPIAGVMPVADQCLNGNLFNFYFQGTPPAIPNGGQIYWDFGPDAVPSSMVGVIDPSNIHYINAGPKTVKVFVVSKGCTSDTAFTTFNVMPPPDATFLVNNSSACLSQCMNLQFLGTTGSQQVYSWDFGLTSNPASSSLPVPGCVTLNDTGYQVISLFIDNLGCKDTFSQTVFVHPLPVISAGPDKDYCYGSGGVTLDGAVVTNSQILAYNWWCNFGCGFNGSANVEDPVVNPGFGPMTYYFQATDLHGCYSNLDSMTVFIKPQPIMNAGIDTSICAYPNAPCIQLQGSIDISNQAPLPFSYSWSPNTGMAAGEDTLLQPCVRPSQTTIYTLYATAANGCTSLGTTLTPLSTTTVFVKPLPIVEAGPHIDMCKNAIVNMNAYAYGATAPYTYLWTPFGGTSGIFNPTDPGTQISPMVSQIYTLTATSDGCQSSDTVSVTVHALPTAVIAPTPDVCAKDSVQLLGVAAGDPTGSLYTYSWVPSAGLSNPNLNNPMASPGVSTQYILYVSFQNCDAAADTANVIIRPSPIPLITMPDTIICANSTIQLNAVYTINATPSSPLWYTWTANGNVLGNGTSITVSPDTITKYFVNISVSGDCPASDSVEVLIMPELNAELSADTTILCGSGSTYLHITGGLGNPLIAWNTTLGLSDSTSLNPQVTISQTTTYIMTMSEGSCSENDTLTIYANPAPVADYGATKMVGCSPFSVSFGELAEDEIAYIWEFGDGSPLSNEENPVHTFTQAGVYNIHLTVLGTGGCTDEISTMSIYVGNGNQANYTSNPDSSVQVMLPDAEIKFTDASTTATSWLWDFGDGLTSSDRNPAHTYELPGKYTVTLVSTDPLGCVSTVQKDYTIIAPEVFIPNVFTPNNDGMFDEWEVTYTGKESFHLDVFDRWGVRVFAADTPEKRFDGHDQKGYGLPSGVYFYTITIGKKEYVGNVTMLE